MNRIGIFFIGALFLGLAVNSHAQSVVAKNRLISEVDQSLTIQKITVLPIADNVSGILSRSVETKLIDLLKANHRFEYVEQRSGSASFDELDEKPETVKDLGRKNGVDAILAGKVFKTPKQTELTLNLYLVNDGLLLAQETQVIDSKVDSGTLEKKTTDLFAKILEKIPYKGMILSRSGTKVTIDMGTRDGIKANQVLSVQQILSVNRHPRFKFILGTEKEIIGKIKVTKSEETLSFAMILQEKEKGIIEKDAKIASPEFVTYADENLPSNIGPMGTMEPNSGEKVSFGNSPREWLPENTPTFGRVQIGLGLGSLQRSSATQGGSKDANVPVFPSIEFKGELWLTPNWFVGAGLSQGIMSLNNASGSTPASLSSTITDYEVRGGYRFLLLQDFFGPQVSVHGGVHTHDTYIDASTPLTFTSTTYSGVFLGVGGSMPVTPDRRYYLDVELNRFFFPRVTERPLTSGDSADSAITQFAFGGSYKANMKLYFTGHIDLSFYSSTFNGPGTRTNASGASDPGLNTSERITQLKAGIIYLF